MRDDHFPHERKVKEYICLSRLVRRMLTVNSLETLGQTFPLDWDLDFEFSFFGAISFAVGSCSLIGHVSDSAE